MLVIILFNSIKHSIGYELLFLFFKLSSLVSSAYNDVHWSTGLRNNPLPYSLRMQTDGNLVIYDNNNVKIWSIPANNGRFVSPRLILQDSGILSVVDATDTVTWDSGLILLVFRFSFLTFSFIC